VETPIGDTVSKRIGDTVSRKIGDTVSNYNMVKKQIMQNAQTKNVFPKKKHCHKTEVVLAMMNKKNHAKKCLWKLCKNAQGKKKAQVA